MNIFIAHSGRDRAAAEKEIARLEALEPRANILLLKNGGVFWKIEAGRLIKKAQMVLFLVGETSHESKNIDWELKQALRSHKLIMYYKLDPGCRLNACLYGADRFSKKETIRAEGAKKIEDIADRVRRYEDGEYKIFNGEIGEMDRSELLEQYKIFLETSERLVERRQTVNSFYISANTALIAVAGGLNTAVGEAGERMLLFLLTSVVGIVLSASWSRTLCAYGALNGSKMKVIRMIEHEMPAALYDTEWSVMSDKLNSKKYVSFTDSERKAPKAFVAFYILILLAAIAMGVGLLL